MFDIVVAWYFVVVYSTSLQHVGPFSHETQCEKMHQWLIRATGKDSRAVSECYYGPAVALTRPAANTTK